PLHDALPIFNNSKKKNVAPQSFKLYGQLVLSVWCFVFLLLCLIYKVHAASLAVTFILSHAFRLVKRNFSFFRSFSLSCRPPRDSFDRIPLLLRNVNPYFSLFPFFFFFVCFRGLAGRSFQIHRCAS